MVTANDITACDLHVTVQFKYDYSDVSSQQSNSLHSPKGRGKGHEIDKCVRHTAFQVPHINSYNWSIKSVIKSSQHEKLTCATSVPYNGGYP